MHETSWQGQDQLTAMVLYAFTVSGQRYVHGFNIAGNTAKETISDRPLWSLNPDTS